MAVLLEFWPCMLKMPGFYFGFGVDCGSEAMSSPEHSTTGDGEDVVLEGDGNGKLEPEELSGKNDSPPPSNGDHSSSGLSDELETESSEDDDEDRSQDTEEQEADFNPEGFNPDPSPSPSKKPKKDSDVEGNPESLDCEAGGSDPKGSSLKKKTKKDPASSAPLLLSPDREESSTRHQDFHTPEKQTGAEPGASPGSSSVLQALLRSPALLPVQVSPVQSLPSDSEEMIQLQNSPAFQIIMGSPPLSPLRDPPALRMPPSSSVGPSTQSPDSSPSPSKTTILRDYLAKPPIIPPRNPEDANAPNVFNPPEENENYVSELVRNSPRLVGLLTGQQPSGSESATSLNIPSQTSGPPSTSETKNELVLPPPTGTEKMSNIQEDDSSEDNSSEGIGSEEPLPSSVNISSEENSADVTDGLAMEIDDGNASAQTKGKLESSQPLVDASETESQSSSDKTKQVSKRSTRSTSQRSKIPASAPEVASGVTSQPASPMSISSEASQDDGTLYESSKRTGRSRKKSEILESIKQGDSSKVSTPARKSKPLQETKKSSGGEAASGGEKSTPSAPELPPAVVPDDKIFKKPSVTPLRLQKMKSRLEGMNLEGPSATGSPARRSARIQSKESGESSKESTSLVKEGKTPRPKPGGQAPSEEGAKDKSKSLSRERISKLKTESGGSRSGSVERGKKPKTRSQEDPPRTKKQDTLPSESGESVARRTRGARLASSSSNSEADKTEEDDTDTPRKVRKSRKDSGK